MFALNPNQFSQVPIKGQLDLAFNYNTISCEIDSTEAATLVPGQAVKMYDRAGGVPKVVAVASDVEDIFGFISYNLKDTGYVAGDAVEVSTFGNVMVLEASAAISRGARVGYVVTGQKIVTSADTKTLVGLALDKAAADGDLVRVMLGTFFGIKTNTEVFTS